MNKSLTTLQMANESVNQAHISLTSGG